MTILEASTLLYDWFSENDSFEETEDFIKIIMVTDHPKRDKAAVIGALEAFQETNILKRVSLEDKDYWMLCKPYSSYSQTVDLSPATATMIAKIINDFCERIGDNSEYANPSEIKEKDIQNLMLMSSEVLTNSDGE